MTDNPRWFSTMTCDVFEVVVRADGSRELDGETRDAHALKFMTDGHQWFIVMIWSVPKLANMMTVLMGSLSRHVMLVILTQWPVALTYLVSLSVVFTSSTMSSVVITGSTPSPWMLAGLTL